MTINEWVVVFDLDDTLISELEYQKSGIAAVEQYVETLYNIAFDGRIQAAFEAEVQDLWGWTVEQLNLPTEVKSSLLWIYRLHKPSIGLADGIRGLLDHLAGHGAQLAVLSDGRSITQRLKLNAVGLGQIPLFISEESGSCKPNPGAFIAVEDKWPRRRYAYVADNPCKDFEAPRARGWLTVGASWVNPRIHASLPDDCSGAKSPHNWIEYPSAVLDLILNS